MAKELLVRINGESTLGAYRGIGRSCKEQIRIDSIIENYIRTRVEEVAGDGGEFDETVSDIIAIVSAWEKVKLV